MSLLIKLYDYIMSNECIETLEYYMSFPPEDTAVIYATRAGYDATRAIATSKLAIKNIETYNKYVIRIANSAATDAMLHSLFINDYLNKYFNLDNRNLVLDDIKIEVQEKAIHTAIAVAKNIKVYVTNLITELDELNIQTMIDNLYKELEIDWEIVNK